MSVAKGFDERARGEFARFGTTRVGPDELLRHPVYTRVLHWSVAIFFVLSLLTGFAIYSPWLFHWIAPLFGGGPRTRALHPWFGLVFEVAFFFQFLNWVGPMAWGEADRHWMKRVRAYATNEERLEAEDVGFFNGGQKLYFWAIVVCGILFLITGLLMWFDNLSPRWVVARSEEHTSELQSQFHLVCRLLLEKKKCSRRAMRQCSSSAHPAETEVRASGPSINGSITCAGCGAPVPPGTCFCFCHDAAFIA